MFLIKVIYLFILAILLALLEIQIEGTAGWAAKLPTWRVKQGSLLDRIYKKIFSQKELTGYHLALNAFLFIFMHWPFIWNLNWSIWDELEIISLFIIFTIIWDFLWFVLNPNFSLNDFNPTKVWWHKKWWGGVPVNYYLGALMALLLFLPEILWLNPITGIYKMLVIVGVNLVLVFITVILYPKAY